jgi:hypothetical protein
LQEGNIEAAGKFNFILVKLLSDFVFALPSLTNRYTFVIIFLLATATYTALVRNPEDKMMMKNFDYYLEKLGTVPEVDLEEPVSTKNYLEKHKSMIFYCRDSPAFITEV